MSTYLRLIRYLRPHLAVFGAAIACMVVTSLLGGVQLGAIFPLADRIITDKVIPEPAWLPTWLAHLVEWFNAVKPRTMLTVFALAIPVLFFMKGLFEFWQTFYMMDASQRVIRDLRQRLFDKFLSLSLDYHHKSPTGQTMSRILYDTSVVQNSIAEGVSDFVYQSGQVLVAMAFTIAINWRLSLLIAVVVPLIAWPISRIGKLLKKFSQQAQKIMGELNSTILESITGIQVIQAFLVEDPVRSKFSATNERAYRLTRKMQKRINSLSPITELIGACAGAIIFWYGGCKVLSGSMTLGTFMAFLLGMLSLIRPLKRLARLHGINQQAVASAERIFEVLDTPSNVIEHAKARVLPTFHRQISYDDVSFHYDSSSRGSGMSATHREAVVDERPSDDGSEDQDSPGGPHSQPALRHISLSIRFGETLALIGPSGGGKTTFVNLLPRFFDPHTGRICIDGIDIRHVTLSSLRRQIGLVTQEPFLFNDTVRANIALGKPTAELPEIIEAAKMANAHTFISRLPKGYDTVIGERGDLLSGGERQRLTIARALLLEPPILILDEATSQLDAQSEHLITEAIERLMKNRTVFMIAHRLSTVRLAHRIVLVQEGRIVEQGSHDELLQKSPLYRRFCELQLMQI